MAGSSEVFTLSYIDVELAAGASFDITQILDWSPASGLAPMLQKGAGVDAFSWVSAGQIAPVVSFTTTQLSNLLGATGPGVKTLAIAADGDDPGITLYLNQLQKGGGRQSGSNHISLNIKEGILVARSISASEGGGPAVMACDIIATYDGTNDPIVIAASQAIAVTPAAAEAYVVGPVNVNGTNLAGVQALQIDCGNQVITRFGDGVVFPQFAARMSHAPTIAVTTDKASYWATLGLGGVAQDATDSVAYLRQCVEGATRAADNAGSHISFSVDEGLIYPTGSGFSLDGAAAVNVGIIPTYDGTNDPIVVSTSASIT